MSDALDRIRQRTKPKVPPRDSSLTSPAPQHLDMQTSRHTDVIEPESPEDTTSLDIQTSRHVDGFSPQPLRDKPSLDIQTSRHTAPSSPETYENQSGLDMQTSSHTDIFGPEGDEDNSEHLYVSTSGHIDIQTSKSLDDPFPTKRSTFRLEAKLIERLHGFCRRHGLSREVLIESMYEYMEDHPEAMEQVVAQAQAKNEYRQQVANRKRAESMISRFGGGEDR